MSKIACCIHYSAFDFVNMSLKTMSVVPFEFFKLLF